MGRLWTEFLTNRQRLIYKWPHYFPIYEQHFGRFVDRPVTFWEIGIASGGSLQMWKRYLGPYAQIVGLDIVRKDAFEEDQIAVRVGDQSDPAVLQGLIDEFGPPDVVLDDGSHVMEHVTSTFSHVYPRMAASGVYVVEDMHTAYAASHGGGLRSSDSFVELAKGLIDELNAEHTEGALAPTEFTHTTLGLHFYDSVIVFERGRHAVRPAFRTGRPLDVARLRLSGRTKGLRAGLDGRRLK